MLSVFEKNVERLSDTKWFDFMLECVSELVREGGFSMVKENESKKLKGRSVNYLFGV